ncbi:hypothetical protein NIES25_24470 [Nostoc linckia NIES-25]|nr:hypothetical protein NIES25_24470 [Nostoc linckia NIES-25]
MKKGKGKGNPTIKIGVSKYGVGNFYRTACLKNLLLIFSIFKNTCSIPCGGKVFNSYPFPLTLSPFPLLGNGNCYLTGKSLPNANRTSPTESIFYLCKRSSSSRWHPTNVDARYWVMKEMGRITNAQCPTSHTF